MDFAVAEVAAATTDPGVDSVTGGDATTTATFEFVLLPFPRAPYVFLPQHLMVESVSTAHVCTYPAEIWLTPVTPETATGTYESAVLPVPN